MREEALRTLYRLRAEFRERNDRPSSLPKAIESLIAEYEKSALGGGRWERAVSLSDERLAKNESLFRAVNERLDDEAAPWSKTTDYLCECSDTACFANIELTNDEYERARSRPTVFMLVPGHQRLEIERVIEENERFLLVEKTVAVEETIEQDPRSNEAGTT